MEKKELKLLGRRLLYAAGKYADYRRYTETLVSLEEEYDETLELYHFEIWEEGGQGTLQGQAAGLLGDTSLMFSELLKDAEEELYGVLKELVQKSREEQESVWGLYWDKAAFSWETFEKLLEEWEESPYVQEEALESLVEQAKRFLKARK